MAKKNKGVDVTESNGSGFENAAGSYAEPTPGGESTAEPSDPVQTEEAEVDEAGVPRSSGDIAADEERQNIEENVDLRKFENDDISVATEQGVKDDVAREEYRKANELAQRRQVGELKAEQEEERVANLSSEANEEQYAVRLQELEEASVDMHLSYNERFEARQKANVLRDVLSDLRGEGNIAGETMPESERPATSVLPRI